MASLQQSGFIGAVLRVALCSLTVATVACGDDVGDRNCNPEGCPAPKAVCLDDAVLKATAPGTCVDGNCQYATETLPCEGSCVDGACVALPTCDTPPADACDDDVVVVFDPQGVFEDGECRYSKTETPCGDQGRICVDEVEGPVCVEVPATCVDGVRNQGETDVDCGGPECSACEPGDRCVDGGDCATRVCERRVCADAKCDDGVRNQDETDVDCGGGCAPCELGESCETGDDCLSWVCGSTGTCSARSCSDGVRNQDESDVDCGGECPPCATGQDCTVASDCASGHCGDGACAEPTCDDGAQDGLETYVDCGGPDCPGCGDGLPCLGDADCASTICSDGLCVPGSCGDGRINGLETDVDCGGGICAGCPEGGPCGSGIDCVSRICAGGACAPPSCDDGRTNGDETGTDCGGPTCDPCLPGEGCISAADCESRVCISLLCGAATCTDTVRNGLETDEDCGGPGCDPCANGATCINDSDCASGNCDPGLGICTPAPTCTDLRRDGDETDVDCGGAICDPCAVGRTCVDADDCATGNCLGGVCGPFARCDDEIRNGDESDVDCGGWNCARCPVGLACTGHGDCSTSTCVGGLCQPASCEDGVLGGAETDVDCGGLGCPRCDPGAVCLVDLDCVEGVCAADGWERRCAEPTCEDGVLNGDEEEIDCGGVCGGGPCLPPPTCDDLLANGEETDVDCGGPDCDGCSVGQICVDAFDCESFLCELGTCSPTTCDDEVQGGDESDIDCGGVVCPGCPAGGVCAAPGDCASGVCSVEGEVFSCQASRCDDWVRNGDETAIDCGGACGGAPCPSECDEGVVWTNLNIVLEGDEGTWFAVVRDAGPGRYEPAAPDCAPSLPADAAEALFRYRFSRSGAVAFSTVSGPVFAETALYALDADCAPDAAQLACMDEPGRGGDLLEVTADAGDVVFVVVDGLSVVGQPYGLRVTYVE